MSTPRRHAARNARDTVMFRAWCNVAQASVERPIASSWRRPVPANEQFHDDDDALTATE
jgi:hypothetical protein